MHKDLHSVVQKEHKESAHSNLLFNTAISLRELLQSKPKPILLVIVLIFFCVVFVSTKGVAQKQQSAKKMLHKKLKGSGKVVDLINLNAGEEIKQEGDDGPQDRLDYEFNRTKDPKLNIVPKYRLMDVLKQHSNSVNAQRANRPLILNGSNSTIGNVSWVERGPNVSKGPGNDNNPSISGRSDAIWVDIDPALPNQTFLGGHNGGLWSCPDITVASPAWSYKDNFANIAITSICQDPTNFNTMYFGTGEKLSRVVGGGIWKSTDHGATWNFLASTTGYYNVSKILCDKNGNLYAGLVGYTKGNNTSSAGVVRSTDGGTTWTDITPAVGGITARDVSDMVYDASNDRMSVYMGYQGTFDTQGYCYGTPSTVTSATWSTPASAATGLGLFAQTNNGTLRIRQTVLAAKGGIVWALQGYSGGNAAVNSGNYTNLYFSADGGATWSLKNNITSGFFDLGQNWYALGIDCDPQNPSTNVVIAGLNPFKSTDGGTTITQIARWVGSSQGGPAAQYVHADIHAVYYHTNNTGLNRVICMDDGGVNYSGDGGATWQDRNTGLRTLEFYSVAGNPSDPNNFITGAQDNGSHQFTQSGLTSTYQVSGGDGAFVAIDQLNPNNQVTAYTYNQYYISTDKGVNLRNSYKATFIDQTGQFINPYDFDSKNKKLYASTTAGQYLRWDDPLTTKNTYPKINVPAISGSIISAISVSPNLNNVIYLAAGGVLVKADNANTANPNFTTITPPTISAQSNISSIVVGPSVTDQDLIITSSSYGTNKVFLSSNGGSTWTDISGNLPDVPVNWATFYSSSNTQVYLATDLGLWYTTQVNGASTVWQADAGIPKVSCRMIKYYDNTNTLALATYGRGLWTAKISTTPKVSYFPSLLSTSKALSNTNANCRFYTDYSDSIQISDAPTGTANVTIAVKGGGTALAGADFDFTTNGNFTSPSSTVTFNNGVSPNKIPITIRIYNNRNKDAILPLTATLTLTVSGTTDAQASTTNQNLLLNLSDNLVPIPNSTSTNQIVWSENWDTWPSSKSSWTFVPEQGSATANSTIIFVPVSEGTCSSQGITGKNVEVIGTDANGALASCGGGATGTPVFYRLVAAKDNFYKNIKVTFDYKSLNGANNNRLVYSSDNGATWTTIQTYQTQSATTNTTETIPSTLNYTNFLLGWSTDGAGGFAIDNISVNTDIAPPDIETTISTASNYYINKATNTDAYSAGNNIFANITNPSADLGCVTASIENIGNTWVSYQGGNRSEKTFVITPTINAAGTTYKGTFYFTNAEIGGRTPSTLKLAKTEASTIAGSTASNTVIVNTTTASYNTTGVSFTGNFTGFSRYFLVDQNVVLPIELITFTGNIVNHTTLLEWVTSSETNNLEFDIQWSADGLNFTTFGMVQSKGNSTTNVDYTFTHGQPIEGNNYYRLKQLDKDGKVSYSKVILVKFDENTAGKPFLYPNPASKSITLNLGKVEPHSVYSLFSAEMRLLRKRNVAVLGLTTTVDISDLSLGVYFIQVIKNGKTTLLRFVKD